MARTFGLVDAGYTLVMPLANLDQIKATIRAKSDVTDVSWVGAHDMARNLTEWVSDHTEDGQFLLRGRNWNDPQTYPATRWTSDGAGDTATGFRCDSPVGRGAVVVTPSSTQRGS